MSETPGRYVFDAESSEHLLFLGAVVTIVADGSDTDGALTVTVIDAPPGYENNLHTHPPAELFYVVDGAMTLYVDREPFRLSVGEFGVVPANRPHGFRVAGDDPLQVLALFAPAGMAAFFRAVGTPVDSREIPPYRGPTAADLGRMAAASPAHDVARLGPLPVEE